MEAGEYCLDCPSFQLSFFPPFHAFAACVCDKWRNMLKVFLWTWIPVNVTQIIACALEIQS